MMRLRDWVGLGLLLAGCSVPAPAPAPASGSVMSAPVMEEAIQAESDLRGADGICGGDGIGGTGCPVD